MADKKIVYGTSLLAVMAGVTIFMFVFARKGTVNAKITGYKIEKTMLIPEKEYAKAAQLNKGTAITKDSLPFFRERLMKHPFVDKVSLEVHSDTLLDVIITEKQAECLLLSGDKKYLLTVNGEILQVTASVKEFDLPVVTGVDAGMAASGKLEPAMLHNIQGIVRSLKDTGEKFSFGKLNEIRWSDGRDVIVSFSDIAPLIIVSRSALTYGVAAIMALEQNRNTHKELIEKASYIDLRYAGKMFAGFATMNKEEQSDERNSSSN